MCEAATEARAGARAGVGMTCGTEQASQTAQVSKPGHSKSLAFLGAPKLRVSYYTLSPELDLAKSVGSVL